MTMTPRVLSANPFNRIEEEEPAGPSRMQSAKSPWPAAVHGEIVSGEAPPDTHGIDWQLAL